MKPEIRIENGHGQTCYPCLRNLTFPRLDTIKLLRDNGVGQLFIAPRAMDRPVGISACYYDEHDRLIYEQILCDDDTAAGIRESVTALLKEGIAIRQQRMRALADARAHKNAQAAGFETVKEHLDYLSEVAEIEIARHKVALEDKTLRGTTYLIDGQVRLSFGRNDYLTASRLDRSSADGRCHLWRGRHGLAAGLRPQPCSRQG
jgi:hypothetical protein